MSADLAGFASFKRQDILLRGGANFQVDMTMKLASLSETITVAGESPMLEVSNPSNVLNISGEFQREMPIQARRNWSDFLEITPGVHSRPFDDGSGRMVYFGHSTEHFAHVVQLEGAIASNYQDAQITYVAMGADMVADTQVKTGGVDASAPMGVGLNINVITKSGGNTFKGSGAFAYQPSGWNGNNVANCSASASCKPAASSSVGTPTTAIIRQFDAGVGGPIQRDKVWFFGSVRRADLEAGISRTAVEVQRLKSFYPNAELFNNTTESTQPYGKVTMQAGGHQIAAFVQQDRLKATGDREYNFSRTNVYSTGGGLYGGKITSVWGQRMTTTFLASYNNKGGSSPSTFEGWGGSRTGDHHPPGGKPHGRTPDRKRPAGVRRELRRRQRTGVVLVSALVANHAARRPHVFQGWPGRLARVPDRLLRGAAQYLRHDDALPQQRLHHGRTAPGGRDRSVEGHDSVPPALCHADRVDWFARRATGTSRSTCRTTGSQPRV